MPRIMTATWEESGILVEIQQVFFTPILSSQLPRREEVGRQFRLIHTDLQPHSWAQVTKVPICLVVLVHLFGGLQRQSSSTHGAQLCFAFVTSFL